MKILCISDIIDPLVYSDAIQKRFGDVDCVIAAGDLVMDYLGFIASSITKPIFFVFGNHHLKHITTFRNRYHSTQGEREILPKTFGATYINERGFLFNKLLIAGLGGCKKYNNGQNQFSEFAMCMKILHLLPRLLWNKIRHGKYLDILVTHAPPLGIHDQNDPCHRGFFCFLWFMKIFRPRYLLHGHVHLYDLQAERCSHYDSTQVINVFSHYVLTVEQ